MDLAERILFFAVGAGFGFMLGLIVSRLRTIEIKLDIVQNEVHEVDTIVKLDHEKNEEGAFEWRKLALPLVILLVVFAAFSSQKAANDSKDAQDKIIETQGQVVALALCNQEFLSKLLLTVNERTEYSTQQASANVELQKSQAAFLTLILSKPGEGENQQVRIDATKKYLDDLTKFVKISEKQSNSFKANPYPTNEEYARCLEKKMQPKESK